MSVARNMFFGDLTTLSLGAKQLLLAIVAGELARIERDLSYTRGYGDSHRLSQEGLLHLAYLECQEKYAQSIQAHLQDATTPISEGEYRLVILLVAQEIARQQALLSGDGLEVVLGELSRCAQSKMELPGDPSMYVRDSPGSVS